MAAETTETAFADTPEGWASRWHLELRTAKEALADFYKVAQAADDAARDEAKDGGGKRLCLYASSNEVISATLFGRTPQASVSRKFADADDDAARLASEMLERVLNCDIQRADDTFSEATRNAMVDWLNAGLGVEWHRYEKGEAEKTPGEPAKVEPTTGAVLAPEVPERESRPNERVNTDYVYFKDFLWGHAKTWDQVPWVARRVQLSREALRERFPDVGELVPLNAKHITADDDKSGEKAHPWNRADVWEIWHRDSKEVFWVVEGFRQLLDRKEDLLGLQGFFPCQKPLIFNPTNSKFIPIPRYKFIQDLLESIDVATTRISRLVNAAKVRGLYAKELGTAVGKLLQGEENEMHPVDDWALFAEKGGLAGALAYLPLEQIVATLATVTQQRQMDMDLLYQVTGQSDLIRGQQAANGTPGEARIKAKSASVRMQSWQDEIARFASDGQRIRAEIISRHFSPETIVAHSNVMQTTDAQAMDVKTGRPLVDAAVELIKSKFSDYRIEVKPEAINLTDFAALKEERMEVLDVVAGALQRLMPVVQLLGPVGLKLAMGVLKINVAGLKGGSAYESLFDQILAEFEKAQQQAAQNPQQPPPDPKLQAQAMKGQQDLAKIQAELQADAQRIQLEVSADAQREMNQRQQNVMEHAAKTQITAAFKPPQMPGGSQR